MNNIEVIRRIYEPKERGVFLEIGDFPENPDYLQLRTADATGVEWFGQLGFSLSPAFALALGEALIASAKEKL